MKTKLVLTLKPNGMVSTGMKTEGEKYPYPCVDKPQDDLADKLLTGVATHKQSTPCG